MWIVESERVQILWAVKLSKVHHMHQMQPTIFHSMNHIRSIECKSCCIRILLTQFGESAISFRVRAFPVIVSFVHEVGHTLRSTSKSTFLYTTTFSLKHIEIQWNECVTFPFFACFLTLLDTLCSSARFKWSAPFLVQILIYRQSAYQMWMVSGRTHSFWISETQMHIFHLEEDPKRPLLRLFLAPFRLPLSLQLDDAFLKALLFGLTRFN